MNKIKQIYRVVYMSDRFAYVGLLRNEKRFNLGDKVFFSINNHDIAFGEIVGVELPPIDNPEYLYKIRIPEELVRERMKHEEFYEGTDIDKVVLDCQKIFNTLEEAKYSAQRNLDRMYELQKEQIGRYFGQFENTTKTDG